MENTVSKYTVSFGLSFSLCSVINALLVVAKEKSHSLSGLMQKMTGHHWVTHAAIIVILFVVLGFVFSRTNGGRGPKISANQLVGDIVGGILASGLIITGFYLIAG
jgi:hypothetical protein